MAGTTVSVRNTTPRGSIERQLVVQLNALVTDLETLRASHAALVTKLNADAGVTDTNYASVAAASLTAAALEDDSGVAITE